MLKTRISLIALGLMAATQAMANDQAASNGFQEDSKASVLLRNAFINRDKKHGSSDQSEWGQAFIGKFSSGFTQGTVGSINVFGGKYQFTENFTGALYTSDVEDVLKKHYLGLNYVHAISDDQSLTLDFNGYKSDIDK
uniref:Outer membrane porin, OprD family n=1 Tax=Steinernema glaseri TaxID=37863 RepID=A0A1I8AK22_9BILA